MARWRRVPGTGSRSTASGTERQAVVVAVADGERGPVRCPAGKRPPLIQCPAMDPADPRPAGESAEGEPPAARPEAPEAITLPTAQTATGEAVPPPPPTEGQAEVASTSPAPEALPKRSFLSWCLARARSIQAWLSPQWFMVVGTFALVVITYHYTDYAYQQVVQMRASVDAITAQTREVTKSADAAEVAAESARLAAEAARDQAQAAKSNNDLLEAAQRRAIQDLKDQRRAWVSFVLGFSAEPSPWQIVALLENTGSTDALKVRGSVRWYVVGPAETAPAVAKEDWRAASWNVPDIISPGQEHTAFIFPLDLKEAQRQEYKDGRLDIVVLVRVEYCDIFGRRHHLTRCGRHSSSLPGDRIDYCGADASNNVSEGRDPECR